LILIFALIAAFYALGSEKIGSDNSTVISNISTIKPSNGMLAGSNITYMSFPESIGIFKSFNESEVANVTGFFLNTNSIYAPIKSYISNNKVIPINLTASLLNSIPTGVTGIEAPYVIPKPEFTPHGFSGNFSLVMFAGKSVGDGDNVVFVYSRTDNWTIYTNGTYYYIDNGTYNVYGFAYGNRTEIPIIVPYNSTVNSSVVAETSSRFPTNFLPMLNTLKTNDSISFVRDGIWWYYGYLSNKFMQSKPPAGFHLWR
jgi:hypothetical protein